MYHDPLDCLPPDPTDPDRQQSYPAQTDLFQLNSSIFINFDRRQQFHQVVPLINALVDDRRQR